MHNKGRSSFMDYFNRRALNEYGGKTKEVREYEWTHEHGSFEQDVPEEIVRSGAKFYTSSYKCPKCKKFMYKANVGEFVWIKTPDGMKPLKSTFGCFECCMLFSAIPGKMLSEGDYYTLKDKRDVMFMTSIISDYALYPPQ